VGVDASQRAMILTAAISSARWLTFALVFVVFATAIDDLQSFPIDRCPALALMRRAYELRANVTAYDAAYIALAEVLGCALVTADARLARAPGIRCPVTILTS